MNTDKGLAKDPLTGAILKGSFEVMGALGHGFNEVIYQRALVYELMDAEIQQGRSVLIM